MRPIVTILVLVVLSLLSMNSQAGGGVAAPERPALHAAFDNKAVGEPIGSRGAVFGEPDSLGGATAEVVEITPGQNVLRISNDLTSTAARTLKFQMIGDAEVDEGLVAISFDFTPSALDRYSIHVRESNGSSKSFLNLNFSPAGVLTASDANGLFLLSVTTYAANTPMRMELVFDMDTRTSSIVIDGVTAVSGHAFGIPDRGVGRIGVGYSSSSNGSAFDLDNLVISGTVPFPLALDADFQDKPAGQPIGLGGALLHEPMDISDALSAVVLEPVSGINILDMNSTDVEAMQSLRWQLLGNMEVQSGLVVIDFDLLHTAQDRYSISLREPGSSVQNFLTLLFQADGSVALLDANGTVDLPDVTYGAGIVYQYRFVYDLDSHVYDIFRDGHALLLEREHGIADRGIGGLLFGIDNGTSPGSHLQIDSLRVHATDLGRTPVAVEFMQEAGSAEVDTSVTPVFQVRVKNVFDEAILDTMQVTLEIQPGTGPLGGTLAGASANTVAGVASFNALTFGLPGTYRLIARSRGASAANSMDIVVSQTPVPDGPVFADGFESEVQK